MDLRLFIAVLMAGLVAPLVASGPSVASAQDRASVARVQEFGRMSRREAQRVVRAISRNLTENAQRGGERYDRVRQAVGRTMFDHPGRSRDEYTTNLGRVLDRMRRGLDEALLEALFPPRHNSSVLCATDFDVTMTACDALVAAASRERATLPYTSPDRGRTLERSLRRERVNRRVARRVASKLREVMLGVPRILRRDDRGRGLLRLLEGCPGALMSRESQIRAWHVGPTEGMARCLAQRVARGQQADAARQRAQLLFGMNESAATAFLAWGAPAAENGSGAAAEAAPAPAAPAAPTWWQVMQAARQQFRAGRFAQAATSYQRAMQIDPTNPRSFGGLGSALLRQGNARSAVSAYRQALHLSPGNPSYHAMLGRAYATMGDRDRATASYQQALAIAPGHRFAQQGLAGLGPPRGAATGPASGTAPPTGGSPGAGRPAAGGGPPAGGRPAGGPLAGGAAGGAARASAPAASSGPTAEEVRAEARAHFGAQRYREAAQSYDRAVRMEPRNAGAYAGLGAAFLAMGNARNAVRAYQQAVRLTPDRSGFWSALARAQAEGNDRNGAVTSLRRALQIDPNNGSAQAGLRALTGGPQPAAPVAPSGAARLEVPSRDQILHVMRPLQDDVAACDPSYQGVLLFRLTITGADGLVTGVTIDNETLAETPTGQCMTDVMHGVSFPPFTREELTVRYPYQL